MWEHIIIWDPSAHDIPTVLFLNIHIRPPSCAVRCDVLIIIHRHKHITMNIIIGLWPADTNREYNIKYIYIKNRYQSWVRNSTIISITSNASVRNGRRPCRVWMSWSSNGASGLPVSFSSKQTHTHTAEYKRRSYLCMPLKCSTLQRHDQIAWAHRTRWNRPSWQLWLHRASLLRPSEPCGGVRCPAVGRGHGGRADQCRRRDTAASGRLDGWVYMLLNGFKWLNQHCFPDCQCRSIRFIIILFNFKFKFPTVLRELF